MNSSAQARLRSAFAGVLLGTAVGDALGLPAENLSPGQIRKPWSGEWHMRFLFGRGMISDDTEHTLMVAQALLSNPDNAAAFQRALGWKFRWWFAGLPGGVGLATAKACLRTKHQNPKQHQNPSFKGGANRSRRQSSEGLEFEVWSFFGAWSSGFGAFIMVSPVGLSPTTLRLGRACPDALSYGDENGRRAG